MNDGRELKYRTKKVAAFTGRHFHPNLPQWISFLGGVVKNKVYEKKPQTTDEMKEFITDAFMYIDSDRTLCRTVCQSVSDRLGACCDVDGGHFEHLRD